MKIRVFGWFRKTSPPEDLKLVKISAKPLHTAQEISNRYTYHAPTPEQIKQFSALRNRAKEYAFMITELCPDSPERDHALHYLDMVVMNANAAIARHSAPDTIARHSAPDTIARHSAPDTIARHSE